MRASLVKRLERVEKDSPVIDPSKQVNRIVLRVMGKSVAPVVLWTRPGFTDADFEEAGNVA